MKHHQYNADFQFVEQPKEFNKFTEKDILQFCLGATLYMPGTKVIADKIINKSMTGLTSMVMCFEDAIREELLEAAEKNVVDHFNILSDAIYHGKITYNELPLIFLRVRNLEQFRSFSDKLTEEQAKILTGFVFPKFYSRNANEYFSHLDEINQKLDVFLYGMPILEGHTIAYIETRCDELLELKNIMESHHNKILNVRVGGTDFSSFFGVRRGINYSIYDILTVRDCLSDILNVLSREEDDFTISGPVWEYFLAYKGDDLDHFLETKDIHSSLMTRTPIINAAIDGLLREVVLDKANGFVGKTIIHPSHTKYVNAMQAVTKEEYDDAMQIVHTGGGVIKSLHSNKMNEINPHYSWAKKIIAKAYAYGVIDDESAYLKLILGKK